MSVAGADTRHRASLATEHGGGLEVENKRRGVRSREVKYTIGGASSRLAVIIAALMRRFASRGGVTWID